MSPARESIRSPFAPLPALFAVCAIDVLGFGILIPLVPFIAVKFGAAPSVITWVLGTYSACQLLAAPLWGRLSDCYGRRPILVTSMLGAAASYVMLAYAHSLATLFVARALAGFMAGNLSAAMAYASDISAPADRAKTMGSVGAAIGIGFMIGPVIGGVLSGDSLQSASFVVPALVSACLSVTAMLLVILVLPESRTSAQRRAQTSAGVPRPSSWRLLRELPALRWLVLATLLTTYSQSTLDSTFALWAMQRFHVGPRTVGLIIFTLAIVAVGTQGLLVRRLAPMFGEARLVLIAISCYVFGLTMLALGAPLPLVALGLLLCGFGTGLFSPNAAAMASHEAQAHNRGAVMGAYQSGTSLARVLAPAVSGPIFQHFGPAAPFIVAGAVTLQALWCILSVEREHANRDASRGVADEHRSLR